MLAIGTGGVVRVFFSHLSYHFLSLSLSLSLSERRLDID